MLILTRRTEESIMLGDGIQLIILEINGKQVRIGIKAPSNVKVYRDNVYERLKKKDHKGFAEAS